MFALKSTYFNSAYMGPMPLKARDNIQKMTELCLDPAGLKYDDWFQWTDQTRSRFAQLLAVSPDSVALGTSVSEFVSHVANGLKLSASDEILLLEEDYPSMILPWLLASERTGVRVRRLPLKTFLEPSRLKTEINSATRLVACSHVMFNTGVQLPVGELGTICRAKEVLFMVDTSQSFGGMTVPFVRNVDISVGVAYKWLLGPYGSAYGYFSEFALNQISRTHGNWLVSPTSKTSDNLLNYTTETLPGARKFDRGQSSSFLITAGLNGSLDILLAQKLESIEKHNRALTVGFLDLLPNTYEVAASRECLSNIVCVRPSAMDVVPLQKKLASKNIDVSVREGRLRISFHFFNTEREVESLLAELA